MSIELFSIAAIPIFVALLLGVIGWAWWKRKPIRWIDVLVLTASIAVLCVLFYRGYMIRVRDRLPELGHPNFVAPEDFKADENQDPSKEEPRK